MFCRVLCGFFLVLLLFLVLRGFFAGSKCVLLGALLVLRGIT